MAGDEDGGHRKGIDPGKAPRDEFPRRELIVPKDLFLGEHRCAGHLPRDFLERRPSVEVLAPRDEPDVLSPQVYHAPSFVADSAKAPRALYFL